jgi:short-subunit dehydrogenase
LFEKVWWITKTIAGFFECLRIEIEDFGVKVAIIYPGPTYTDLIKEVFSDKQPFYQKWLFFSSLEVFFLSIVSFNKAYKISHISRFT